MTGPERATGPEESSVWAATVPGATTVTAESAAVSTDPTPTPVGGVALYEERPPRGWGRRIAVAVALLLLAGVCYYAITWYQVWSTGRSDERRPVDAIVVMGAAQYDGRPSPQLRARLDHVLTLWEEGWAPTVVVTGGNQPGDRFTEAEASTAYLVERGVPESAILAEDEADNSYDSLVGVRDLLPAGASVLLVSDPFHSLRIELTAEELGLDAHVSPTRTSPVQGRTERAQEAKEAAGVALGRIIGFERLLSITG